ncbi:Uncharacterized protein Fot_29773 [Forsythia ovata]|uniref:Uncharacterized protein n=1 Tax=Forsythia ovata TaxID=205694 RepID=A0ABD1TSU1_9LAMI
MLEVSEGVMEGVESLSRRQDKYNEQFRVFPIKTPWTFLGYCLILSRRQLIKVSRAGVTKYRESLSRRRDKYNERFEYSRSRLHEPCWDIVSASLVENRSTFLELGLRRISVSGASAFSQPDYLHKIQPAFLCE